MLDSRPHQDEPPTAVPGAGDAGVPLPRRLPARLLRRAGLFGPAFVVSVAYIDPGNFATNMSSGARYGYLLLWVIAAANLLAMFVQALSAKLGIATGRNLPQLCRDHLPRPLTMVLWVQGELVAIATDLAEFIGGALALNLLFGIPLLPGAMITAVVSFALLGLAPRGRHRFEAVITGMLVIVVAGFAYQVLRSGSLAGAVDGLVPRLAGPDSLLMATGIIGATVMPHVIYLHSALTQDHGRISGLRAAVRASRADIAIALGVAGLVNMAMLTVAAATFHSGDPGSLQAIHAGIGAILGPAAAVAFALALLASGLASSSVGTYAGQVIMEGFLRRRIPLTARRLITIVPAMMILSAGIDPTRALILSQVALSFGIPFALVPLLAFTSNRRLMGALVNRRRTTALGITVATVIIALNGFLVAQVFTG
ncbi:Nramp family divalent metal transporter [Streptosporangium sp. NBC_01756]|uniref:Nramp family divalent metal transporter n=1 Tax=Streptosporangium sp. NBC_01756 TaxID=2975950 RepID=UPI002DDB4571|nr:Nramp family divalent metal transporter [Streptosporangium sp. NBC_01756]WSC86751.1 Nramp family divalent metal transporter [Streptosporangium sp. NBC_01756]